MADINKVKDFFKDDVFAMKMGIEILEVSEAESLCAFSIHPEHFNANGAVQGGAIFTLADFTFAVAANCESKRTVSSSANITFIRPGTGKLLFARARKISGGKRTCLYEVIVTNEEDMLIAHVNVNGFVISEA